MSTIVTRAGKGSALTHTEADANFTNLNTDKAELSDLASTANAKGASLIGIEDSAGNFTATTVEGALKEHVEDIDAVHGSTSSLVASSIVQRDSSGRTRFNSPSHPNDAATKDYVDTTTQPVDATLTSLSALGTAADKYAYTTGIDTWAEGAITAFGRSIIDDADEATFKATVNLEIGTDVQAYDATLTALAGTLTAANKIPYATALDTAGELDFLDEDNMASDSAAAVPSQQSVKAYVDAKKIAGDVVQVVNVQDGAVATGTTILPLDDTIPQNTEGDEYMTLAITPTSATNLLKIDITVNLAHSTTSTVMSTALFQDTTADALAAAYGAKNDTADAVAQINFTHYMTAGTTSATTFKVRAGNPNAGTTTFNGQGGARRFGGVIASSITITEIQA